MRQVGNGAGYLFSRGFYRYSDIDELRESASERMDGDFDVLVGKSNYVFVVFDNDLFYWFDTTHRVDDPPVYAWNSKEKTSVKAYDSFSRLILWSINYEFRNKGYRRSIQNLSEDSG
jgi:hypothetical protein